MNKPLLSVLLACVGAVVADCANIEPHKTAGVDLGPWPGNASPQEIGRRVAGNFLPRPNMLMAPDGVIHYSQVCTWYGALTFAQLTGNAQLQAALVKRYHELMAPENGKLIPNREHVDYSVFGVLPLQIYLQTGDTNALALGKSKADKQWENPRDDGLSRQTRFWIDDMYMISSLQAQAFRATGNKVYLDRAANEMVAYLGKLQQTSGLFFHGDQGKFFWGRGNGWMAAGMAELLLVLPPDHPQRARIMNGYRQMMAALLKYQDSNGMWHQLVDHPEAWPETSCTGMFTFAMITGVKNGWLDKDVYGPAAHKGWLALVSYLKEDGSIRDVCPGMGQQSTAQGYLNAKRGDGDFHGQAPILWCASALLR
ncbi:MAG: glycoside hydrolase family 88 protein [Verrucomicrobiota bacterium]|jgi:rhamnogalacturonyl hydrolase YesR